MVQKLVIRDGDDLTGLLLSSRVGFRHLRECQGSLGTPFMLSRVSES